MTARTRSLLARTLSPICYGVGHLVSLVMNNRAACVLYPIYNRLMIWSVGIEDWAGAEVMWRRRK